MSWRPHKTTSQRKIITIQEWAEYIGVSKNTIIAWKGTYVREGYAYNPRHIYAIFNFLIYAVIRKNAPLFDFLKVLLKKQSPPSLRD